MDAVAKMRKSLKCSPDVIECAVRMVFDANDQYSSQWAAFESIGGKTRCIGKTLRECVRLRDRHRGVQPGAMGGPQRIKELEHEVR